MKESIKERVYQIAAYIMESGATVRAAARVFDVSKSTVHTDMTVRLPVLDKGSARVVQAILNKNREERHIRGGESTKRKYGKMR